MMKASVLKNIILPMAILFAGFGAVPTLSGYIERHRPQLGEGYEDSDLQMNAGWLRGYAFGGEGLIADWYFMRALQYIGDKLLKNPEMVIDLEDLRPLNPRLLYPLLQNATDLDPHFIAAYSYGAMVLPAIDPEKAIEMAKKGIANNPNAWRLHQHLAYIYWKLGRYDEASEAYEKGSKIAGAAPFMRLMAAAVKTEGGSRETSRAIYKEMLDSSNDEQVRITAQRRLRELDSLDERDEIDRVLTEFKERNGRCANSFSEITPGLLAVKLPTGRGLRADSGNRPVDPTGAPYLLDIENCRVGLDRQHTGLPVK
jgi:tetratricopeptide (TPR) repeat protein